MPVYAIGRTEQFVKGISVNTVNGSITEYLNYPFNSFATLEGKPLGANENGLYLLEGDDDDGVAIAATFKIALQDFGSSLLKRLRACYIGIKFTGQLIIKPIDEEEVVGSPTLITSADTGYNTRRAKFGRGPKNRYWGIEVSNKNGEDFKIDTIELEQMPTVRRIG